MDEEEVYDMIPIKTEHIGEEEMGSMTLGYVDPDEANLEYHHMGSEYYGSDEEDEVEEDESHSPFEDDLIMNSENVETGCSPSTSQLIYNQSPHQQHFARGNQVYVQHHNVAFIESRQILQKHSVVHQKVTTVSQPAKKQQVFKRLSDQVDLHVVPRADQKNVNIRQLSNVNSRQQIQQSSLVKVSNPPAQHITASQHTVTQFSQKSPVTTISTSDVRVQRIMSQIKQSESSPSQHQNMYQQSQVHIKQQQIQRQTHMQQHIQQENISVRTQSAQQKLVTNQNIQGQQQLVYPQQENVRRVARPTQQIVHQSPQGSQEVKAQNIRSAQQPQPSQSVVQQASASSVRVQVSEKQSAVGVLHTTEEQNAQTLETPLYVLPERFKNMISVRAVPSSPTAVCVPVQVSNHSQSSVRSPGQSNSGVVKHVVIAQPASGRPKGIAGKQTMQSSNVTNNQASLVNSNQLAGLSQPGLSCANDEMAPMQKFRESPQSQSSVGSHPVQSLTSQQYQQQPQILNHQQQVHSQQQHQQLHQQQQQLHQQQQQQGQVPKQQLNQQQQQPVQQQPQQIHQHQQQSQPIQQQQQQRQLQLPHQPNDSQMTRINTLQRQQPRKPQVQNTNTANVAHVMSPRQPNADQSPRVRGRFSAVSPGANAKSSNLQAAPTNVKPVVMGPPNIIQSKIRPSMNKDNFVSYPNIHNGGRPGPVAGPRPPIIPSLPLPRTPVTTNLNQHVTLTSIPSKFITQTPSPAKTETSKSRGLLNIKQNKIMQEIHAFEVQTNEGNIVMTPEEFLQELDNLKSGSSESEHSGNESELEKEEREALECEPSPPSKSPEPQETVKHVEGFFALCTFCGYLSLNFGNCERCKRKLPKEIKMVPIGTSKLSSNIVITMKENPPPLPVPPPTAAQLQMLQQAQQKFNAVKQGMDTKKPNTGRNVQSQVPKKKRVSRKKNEEPECLTISSDEEAADTASDCSQSINNIRRDPATSTAPCLKEPVITDEHESESENITQGVKGGGLPETDIDQLFNESLQNEFTRLQCRTVRVGSYKVVPKDLVLLSQIGVKITVPSLEDSNVHVCLNIHFDEIVRVLIHFGKQLPVLFLYITPIAGAEVRKVLKMEKKEGHYFDPTSKDETHKRITLLPEKITDDSRAALKKIFSSEDKGANKFEELSAKEANDILVRASPKEIKQMNSKSPEQ